MSLQTFAPLDGAHLSEPFTGTISFTPPNGDQQRAARLARGRCCPAGKAATATITVTNTGNIAKDYFADPRLNRQAPLTLLGTNVVGGTSYNKAQLTRARSR